MYFSKCENHISWMNLERKLKLPEYLSQVHSQDNRFVGDLSIYPADILNSQAWYDQSRPNLFIFDSLYSQWSSMFQNIQYAFISRVQETRFRECHCPVSVTRSAPRGGWAGLYWPPNHENIGIIIVWDSDVTTWENCQILNHHACWLSEHQPS